MQGHTLAPPADNGRPLPLFSGCKLPKATRKQALSNDISSVQATFGARAVHATTRIGALLAGDPFMSDPIPRQEVYVYIRTTRRGKPSVWNVPNTRQTLRGHF